MRLKTYSQMMQEGGQQQGDPMQQVAQMIMQALSQGTAPEEIVQMLVQQGVPQDQAMQLVQQVMQSMQGQQQGAAPEQQMQAPQEQQMQMQRGGLRQSPLSSLKNYITPEQYKYLQQFM